MLAVDSWMAQERTERDRLVLLGDGCVPNVPWRAETGVEILSLPKVGNYGFQHIERYLRETDCAGDYVTILDDDDIWMPGFFRAARPFLRKSKEGEAKMVCFTKVNWTGDFVYFEYALRDGVIRGLKAFVPWHPTMAGFWGRGIWSDGNFWRGESQKHPLSLMPVPGQVTYAPLMTREMWHALGLEVIAPWNLDMKEWLPEGPKTMVLVW